MMRVLKNISKLLLLSLLVLSMSACKNNDEDDSDLTSGGGGSGGTDGGGGTTTPTCTFNGTIFIATDINKDGDLGGISGADSKCQNSTVKPNDNCNYKALLVDGANRSASSNTDWVLKANQAYQLIDGTQIGTTNGGAIFTSLTNGVGSGEWWTGIADDSWNDAANDCSNWTSTSGNAMMGTGGNNTLDKNFNDGTRDCNTPRDLICVQQES